MANARTPLGTGVDLISVVWTRQEPRAHRRPLPRLPVSKPTSVAAPPPPPPMDPPAHVEWVPLQGQRGDGRTALNAKFGY
ncbi:hypothetical protein BC828DRAFT_408161 [Blastocladiella britannica]|nr:hypothetical protein BC828DRAFT_408161 [Blastocladiella britannica]